MIPEVLFNTNLFVDGTSFAGDVPSFTPPKVTLKTEEFRGGGMAGPIELAMGVEKMEGSFVTTGMRRESLKFFGLADGTACNAVFRGSFRGQKGQTRAVIATVRGMLKEVDLGDWKAGDKAEIKHTMAVSYYKLEVDGRLMYEIDMVNAVLVIDGVDQLASMRADLGL
ncbi:phage major tail tube protein [Pseudomonas helleri]|uniref:phage major tail tube protein n=1 Tax=Pseudomonas helleri TaxID=1608996 RepID=UPI001296686F|nr:phage major tail tube protein [Pseudomonas helleri]MQU22129.1 phage major tail tube protein [Pseudomonas helleri]